MHVRRLFTAGALPLCAALCGGALAAGPASAQLLGTGAGSFISANGADEGLGQGVDVSTATTLTRVGFYLGTYTANTSIKYLVYDATANALVYSQTRTLASATADNTLVLSDPFSYALLAGRTYYFGIIANDSLDVGYNYVSGSPLSSNGLTLDDPNILFSGFASPTTDLSTAGASIAIALYGTQASAVPEPATLALVAFGLAGVGAAARRTAARSA